MFIIRLSVSTGCRKQPTIIPEGGRVACTAAFLFIYASNEPKSVLARDLGDCRDNLRNSRSVFLIVYQKDSKQSYQPELCIRLNKPYQRFRSEVSEQI